MSLIEPTSVRSESQLAWNRLCVLATIASIVTCSIAVLYPSGPAVTAVSALGFFAIGWIWSQSVLLVLPGLLIGAAVMQRWQRLGSLVGGLLILAAPLLVLCDAITFSWIGERFLSGSVWRLATSLRESLTNHVSQGTSAFAALTVTASLAGSMLAWWISGRLAKRISRPWLLVALVMLCALMAGIPAVWRIQRTRREMAELSPRHPLCTVGLVAYRGVGPEKESHSTPPGGGLASAMETLIATRQREHLALTVAPTGGPLRDAVIVVIESFRHELVDPEVMPNLWDLAQRGIHCRTHFSSGNATTHGMFSLLSGLEAVWYSRQMNSRPLLNRLFRSAGYEIGFFAGHNDWKKFHMDGFINRGQFDVFETEDPRWLESDRRATQRAVNFLQHSAGPEDAEQKPRLAILYLYSTHADYHSYAGDRIFQPAADDRFVIPYKKDFVPKVWNRYKNSARSVDRFLSAVFDEDRVVIVTGDHGESFLEDGVCGHGVRISRYQNMTPAVIYRPGGSQQTILQPTMHADLLPSLLSAVGLQLSDPAVLDGIDLFNPPDSRLADRLFVTRNYLSDDCALIGLKLDDACFGYRCAISLDEWRATPLNPIDDGGYQQTAAINGDALIRQWVFDRFPGVKRMPTVSQQ